MSLGIRLLLLQERLGFKLSILGFLCSLFLREEKCLVELANIRKGSALLMVSFWSSGLLSGFGFVLCYFVIG